MQISADVRRRPSRARITIYKVVVTKQIPSKLQVQDHNWPKTQRNKAEGLFTQFLWTDLKSKGLL